MIDAAGDVPHRTKGVADRIRTCYLRDHILLLSSFIGQAPAFRAVLFLIPIVSRYPVRHCYDIPILCVTDRLAHLPHVSLSELIAPKNLASLGTINPDPYVSGQSTKAGAAVMEPYT